VKEIHHRMPLILKPEVYDEWLDPQIKEPARIEEILARGAVKDLRGHPVSKLVNRAGNNRRACIEPLKDTAGSKPVETTHEEGWKSPNTSFR
jgi:putative SOS response-associated peptidase YedK